jgi:hypothetical protein
MALLTLAGVTVFPGCAAPAGPSPPGPVHVQYGIVVDQSDTCIEGATATIIGGERDGEVVTQKTPCTALDEEGELGGGFVVRGLTRGQTLTLRGSAPGSDSRDVSVVVPTFEVLVFRLTPRE